MSGQNSRWMQALWGTALGGYCSAITRAGAQVLDDLQLQQTAALAALGFAVGPCLLALRAARVESSRGSKAQAWSATSAALALLLGAAAWLRVTRMLPPEDAATFGAASLLALPLCTVAYASVENVQAWRRDFGVFLACLGLGASLAQLGIAVIGAERVLGQSCLVAALAALLSARSPASARGDLLWLTSGATFLAALATAGWAASVLPIGSQPPPLGELGALRERLATRGFELAARADAWDAFGHLEAFEIVDNAKQASGLGVLLRDSALLAPMLNAEARTAAGWPRALCNDTLVAEPYARPRPHVLLAGIGGALELQCALVHGASRIEVAEPSRALLGLLRGPIAGWLGGLGNAQQLRFHPVSARDFVRRPHGIRGFDLIAIGAAATKHRLPSGILPIPVPEALLETDRGLSELLGALAPDGVLFAVLQGEPLALRFATLASSALRLRGEQKPENSIVVHESAGTYGIQVRRTPFALDEVLDMHARAPKPQVEPASKSPALADWLLRSASGRSELRYTPGAGFANRFGALFARAAQPELAQFQSQYLFDISAPSDDRPLFDEITRRDRSDTWSSTSPYRALLQLVLFALAVALALAALVWWGRPAPKLGGIRSFVTLACLGAVQPLAFGLVLHLLSIWSPSPRHGVVLVLGIPLGAGLGVARGNRLLRAQPLPQLLGHGVALVVFALVAVGLGPILELSSHASSGLTLAIGLFAAATLGFALALPWCAPHPNPTRALAVSLLAGASSVPATSMLVLFAGYGAVAASTATLLAISTLLALRPNR